MPVRSNLLAAALVTGMIAIPTIAVAQTMVVAPLPPMSRPDTRAAPTAAPVRIDPGAALVESEMARSRIEHHQQAQIAQPRPDRDVPMPRPVMSIIAPARP